MVDKLDAQKIVQQWIDTRAGEMKGEVVIEEFTIDKPYGWVFFFNRRRFLETRKATDGLAGNGPIIVEKENGALHAFGSAKDPQAYIEEFDSRRFSRANAKASE